MKQRHLDSRNFVCLAGLPLKRKNAARSFKLIAASVAVVLGLVAAESAQADVIFDAPNLTINGADDGGNDDIVFSVSGGAGVAPSGVGVASVGINDGAAGVIAELYFGFSDPTQPVVEGYNNFGFVTTGDNDVNGHPNVSMLSSGNVIGSSSTYAPGLGSFANWVGQGEQVMGFETGDGVNTYYGYATISVDATSITLINESVK